MPALRDRAFEAGVKCISGEQCEKGRLVCITCVVSIFIDHGLEARDPANWLSRARPEKQVRESTS